MTVAQPRRPLVPSTGPRRLHRHPWPVTLVLAVWLAPLQAQTPLSLEAAGAAVQGLLGVATPAVPPTVPAAPPAGQAEGLADLLARVLPRDPQVRAATAMRQAADERLRQARSRLGPALYLQVVGGQSRSTASPGR